MDYIVFDLEWNQSLEEDEAYDRELPFEIIEIGAVKLGPDMELKGMFSQTVQPQVYKKLHFITRELLHIEQEDLEKGGAFADVFEDFMKFCGEDFVFCTWGDADVFELLNNAKYFNVKSPFCKPVKYYDLQKLYSRQNHLGKTRLRLQAVAEAQNIRIDEGFHRAFNDAKYTAEVMRRMDMEKLKNDFSVDTFYVPNCREDEVLIQGDGYTKLVTRTFRDRSEMMEDPVVSAVRCPRCGRNCKRLIPWFLGTGKSYHVLGKCIRHGLVAGKIKTKHGPQDTLFAIKKIKAATEEDALVIKQKKALRVEQQRKKRHHRQVSAQSKS